MSDKIARLGTRTGFARRTAVRNRKVRCEMTNRWLQFPTSISDLKPDDKADIGDRHAPSDLFVLDVMTKNEISERESKVCELVVSLRELMMVVEEMSGKKLF